MTRRDFFKTILGKSKKQQITKEWLLTLPGVSYHSTEPGRGYFMYRSSPNNGFSTPDMEEFIEDLKDVNSLKSFFKQ